MNFTLSAVISNANELMEIHFDNKELAEFATKEFGDGYGCEHHKITNIQQLKDLQAEYSNNPFDLDLVRESLECGRITENEL